jgi:hypothetical protein
MLFMGDNGTNGAAQEAVLPLIQDGITTTSWGTTLFLMASAWKADMDLSHYSVNGVDAWLPSGTVDNVPNDGVDTVLVKSYAYGTSEYWAGNRARSQLVAKFFPNGDAPQTNIQETYQNAGDDRALFFGIGREQKVTTPTEYTSGFAVGKFRNTYAGEGAPHNSQFIDTDYFLMHASTAAPPRRQVPITSMPCATVPTLILATAIHSTRSSTSVRVSSTSRDSAAPTSSASDSSTAVRTCGTGRLARRTVQVSTSTSTSLPFPMRM